MATSTAIEQPGRDEAAATEPVVDRRRQTRFRRGDLAVGSSITWIVSRQDEHDMAKRLSRNRVPGRLP
jgi:hypothetical protein